MQIRLPSGHRGLSNDGMKDQTLTKVSLYLDSILVDRDSLAWDKGALVAGLLEGHKEFTWDRNQKQRRVFKTNVPVWVNSRGNHVAYVIRHPTINPGTAHVL